MFDSYQVQDLVERKEASLLASSGRFSAVYFVAEEWQHSEQDKGGQLQKEAEKSRQVEIDPYLQEKSKSLKKRQDAYYSIYDDISIFSLRGVFLGYGSLSVEGFSLFTLSHTSLLLGLTSVFSIDLANRDSLVAPLPEGVLGVEEEYQSEATRLQLSQRDLDETVDFLATTTQGSGESQDYAVSTNLLIFSAQSETALDSGIIADSALTTTVNLPDYFFYGNEAVTRDILESLITDNVVDLSYFFTDNDDVFILQEHQEALALLQDYSAFQLEAKFGNDTIILSGLDGFFIKSVNLYSGNTRLDLTASNSFIGTIYDYEAIKEASSTVTLNLESSYVEVINLNENSDVFISNSDFSTFETVLLGEGIDIAFLNGTGSNYIYFDTGTGNDQVYINTLFTRFGQIVTGLGNDFVIIESPENIIESLSLGGGNDKLFLDHQVDPIGAPDLGAGNDQVYVVVSSDYPREDLEVINYFLGGEAEESSSTVTSFSSSLVLASTIDPEDGFYTYRFPGDTFFVQFDTVLDYMNYLDVNSFTSAVDIDAILDTIVLTDSIFLKDEGLGLPFQLLEMENIGFVLEDPYLFASYFTTGADTFVLSEHAQELTYLAATRGAYFNSLAGDDTLTLDQVNNVFFGKVDLSTGVGELTLDRLTQVTVGDITTSSEDDTLFLTDLSFVEINNINTYTGADTLTLQNSSDVTFHNIQLGGGGNEQVNLQGARITIDLIDDGTASETSNSNFTLQLVDSYVGSLQFRSGSDRMSFYGANTTYDTIGAGTGSDFIDVFGTGLTFNTFTFFASGAEPNIGNFSVVGDGTTFHDLKFANGNDRLRLEGTNQVLTAFEAGSGNDKVEVSSHLTLASASILLQEGNDIFYQTIDSTYTAFSGTSSVEILGGETAESETLNQVITGSFVLASTEDAVDNLNTYNLGGDTLWIRFYTVQDYETYLTENGFTNALELETFIRSLDFSQRLDLATLLGLNLEIEEIEQILFVLEDTQAFSSFFTGETDTLILDDEQGLRNLLEILGQGEILALEGDDVLQLNDLSDVYFTTINLGSGDDAFTAVSFTNVGMGEVNSERGADTFVFDGLQSVTIDTFTTGLEADNVTITNADDVSIETMNLEGGGVDRLTLTASNSYFGSIRDFTGGGSSNSVFHINLTDSYVGDLQFAAGKENVILEGSNTTFAFFEAGAADNDTWLIRGSNLTFTYMNFYPSATGNNIVLPVEGTGHTFVEINFTNGNDLLDVSGSGHTFTEFNAGEGNDTMSVETQTTIINSNIYLQGGDDSFDIKVDSSFTPYIGTVNNEIYGGETTESTTRDLQVLSALVVASSEESIDRLNTFDQTGDSLWVRFATAADYQTYLTQAGWASTDALEAYLRTIDFSTRAELATSLGFNLAIQEFEHIFFLVEELEPLSSYFTSGADTFILENELGALALMDLLGQANLYALEGADSLTFANQSDYFFGTMHLGSGSNTLTFSQMTNLGINTLNTGGTGSSVLFDQISGLALGSVIMAEGVADSLTITNVTDLTIGSVVFNGGLGEDLIIQATNVTIGSLTDHKTGSSSLGDFTLDLTNATVEYIELLVGGDRLDISGTNATYQEIQIQDDATDFVRIDGSQITVEDLTVIGATTVPGLDIIVGGSSNSFTTMTFQTGADALTITGNDHTFQTILFSGGDDQLLLNGSAIFGDVQGGAGADLVKWTGDNLGVNTGISTFSMGDGSDLIVFQVSSLKEGIIVDGGTLNEGTISSAHLSEVQSANELFSTSTVDANTTGDTLLLLFQDQTEFATFLTTQGITQTAFEQAMTDLVASGATPFDLQAAVGLDIEASSIEQVVVGTL